jgi:hypothetical protein
MHLNLTGLAAGLAAFLGIWIGHISVRVVERRSASITAGWDALELFRQQRRVERGHAPANPLNPRHARILAECPAATTLDLLDRQPLGRPVAPDEARALAGGERREAG